MTKNIDAVAEMVRDANERGAEFVFLPENVISQKKMRTLHHGAGKNLPCTNTMP